MVENKRKEMNGTMEQGLETVSISEILKKLYIESYGLEGLTEYQIECKIAESQTRTSKDWIPPLENFIHERRRWIKRIISALVDEEAYELLQIKQYGFPKCAIGFIESLLYNGVHFSELRKKIVNQKYFDIAEEDIEVLRNWIDEIFTDVVCDKDRKDKILEIFDSHFSLKYRNVQKELYELQSILGPNHIMQYSEESYDWILKELIELNKEIINRMEWPEINKEEREALESKEYFKK